MIAEVLLDNFKAHARTELSLEPFTVLVGANGVGKTSVLEGLHILSQSLHKPLSEFLSDPWSPSRIARSADRPITLQAKHRRVDSTVNFLNLKIEADGVGFTSTGSLDPGGIVFDENHSFAELNKQHPLLHDARSAMLLRLDARAIARTGFIRPGGARVEYDGANTGAVIASWKLADDERLAKATDALRQVVPQVCALRVEGVAQDDNNANGYSLFVDFDDAKKVPAALVSEGTLVAISLIVLLHAKPQPHLVLLDDLGAELHPSAQGDLVALLHRIQSQNPKLQIVASTHSPYVLDALNPEQVRVFARGADGAARGKSLADHPDARQEGITTGQLWTMDSEAWVLEGQS